MYEMTKEEIAAAYNATLDSVALINSLRDKRVLDEEEADDLRRNVEHVKLMLDAGIWTTEDLTPLKKAVAGL